MRTLLAFVICVFALVACQANNPKSTTTNEVEAVVVSEKTAAEVESVVVSEEVVTESEDEATESEDEASDDKIRCLNDIRFGNWTEKDWYDNDYIRALRQYVDEYLQSEMMNPGLDSYRPYMKGKFVVLSMDLFIAGGLLMTFVFVENPQYAFETWVYSSVMSDESVSYHEVRSVRLFADDCPLTKSDVMEILQENPQLKMW